MKQINFQNELHFDFTIEKLANVPIFVQAVSIPGIFTEAPQTSTQFSPIKHIGDTTFFQDLVVTIKLDEGMEVWFEMFKWITGLTRVQSYQEFLDLIQNKTKTLDGIKKLYRYQEPEVVIGKGYRNIKSTASLGVSDGNHLKYLEIVFSQIHPVSMGPLTFRTDNSGVGFITFEVTFSYNFYYPRPFS